MEQAWVNNAMVFVVIGVTIVVGVMLLRLFFDLRAHLKRRLFVQDRLIKALPGIDGMAGLMQVRLKDGKMYAGLRLVGVMDVDAARDAGLPNPLTNLVVFARQDDTRVWIDASAIRVIETLRDKVEVD